jgi:hypothetical protein
MYYISFNDPLKINLNSKTTLINSSTEGTFIITWINLKTCIKSSIDIDLAVNNINSRSYIEIIPITINS